MRRALLLTGTLVVLAGCGEGDGDNADRPSGSAPETITITATEYSLRPSSIASDTSGTHTFEVVNEGEVAHALEIEGQGIEEETETLDPGERASLTVDLSPGTYELYCPVGDHAERGMTGRVDVRASGAPLPAETTDESDDGY